MGRSVCVRVLGPVGLERDGEPVTVRSGRQRAILAVLAAAGGHAVGGDVLVEALWGDALPAAPEAALRTQITRVRGLIGDPSSVVHRAGGYALDVDEIDASSFEHAVRDAAGAPAARRAELLADALALWRGQAFGGCPGLPGVRPEAARLEDLRLRASEDHAGALLEAGDPAGAVTALEALVADEPLRERARALLMRSLYACGRATEALASYQDHRRLLAEELGLTPSPMLAELERSILTHRLAEPVTDDADASRPTNLPPLPVSDLVGRRDELGRLATLLETARVATVTGPGGVGKTRLALHVAHEIGSRYPDGVWWCDVTAAGDTDVAAAVASVLGVDDRAGDTVHDRVLTVLGRRRTLLVLDNCEHVLDGVADLVDPLVRTSPAVDVLVTSRQALGIDGEHRFGLDPLPIPAGAEVTDAVELFLRRVRAVDPDAVAREGAWDGVLRICRSLDGLPLALEFAAARVAHMTVLDVASQLDDRFELLSPTLRSNDPRHAGLAATLAWSYQLLSEHERCVLDALSMFAGAFTLDDATRLCGAVPGADGRAVGPVVGGLVDKSLVELGSVRGSGRYHLLESVRAYGAERLRSAGRAARWRRRHAAFVVGLVERTDLALRGPDEPAHQHVLDEHAGDLRTARAFLIDDGDLDGLLRLCAGLRWFTDLRTWSEPVRWAEDAAARVTPGAADHPLLPGVLALAAAGAVRRGELDEAATLAERADELSGRTSGSGVEILGRLALFRGDLDDAVRYGEEAADRFGSVGDHFSAVQASTVAVVGLRFAGRREEAHAAAERLLHGAAALGCPSQLAFAEYCAAEVVVDDPERARSHLLRARDLARSSGAEFVLGLTLTTLAGLDVRRGATGAAEHLRGALDHWERAGSWKQQWWLTLRVLIDLLSDLDRLWDVAVLAAAFEASPTPGPVYGDDADRFRAAVGRAGAALGADRFDSATAVGASLDDAAALAYGRDALDDVVSGGETHM